MQMICYLTTISNYLPIHWIHNYRLKVSKGPMEGSQREVHEISLFDKAMHEYKKYMYIWNETTQF